MTVSETAARAYKRKFHRTMDRELCGRNPLIESIFRDPRGASAYYRVRQRLPRARAYAICRTGRQGRAPSIICGRWSLGAVNF
jgi:hypothetical protein